MIKYFIILVFILSIASATGSILISSKLRNSYRSDVFSTLMYLLIFYFTFGFYAIWGQVIIVSFLSPFLVQDILNKTMNILALLGTPFIVIAWFMLLRFTRELSGRSYNNSFILWYLFMNILLLVTIVVVSKAYPVLDQFTIIKISYLVFNFSYSLIGIMYLLYNRKKKSLLRKRDMQKLAAGLLVIMLFHNLMLILYNGNVYIALAFILIFFLGGSFIPLYIRYQSDLTVFLPDLEYKTTFDALCKDFEITPREKEIIYEICSGLTNQQIADKLFISLQTVKDHTHRIYFKINCSSRAQLIALVKDKT